MTQLDMESRIVEVLQKDPSSFEQILKDLGISKTEDGPVMRTLIQMYNNKLVQYDYEGGLWLLSAGVKAT